FTQQVRDTLVNNAVAGKVAGAATGSPNKLLFTGTVAAPAPAPAPAPVCGPVTNNTDVAIPDLTTVASPVTVAGCTGNASATSTVEVHIKHTFRGDLAITLVAPDGSTYALKSANPNDSAADVNATWTVNLSARSATASGSCRCTTTHRTTPATSTAGP